MLLLFIHFLVVSYFIFYYYPHLFGTIVFNLRKCTCSIVFGGNELDEFGNPFSKKGHAIDIRVDGEN